MEKTEKLVLLSGAGCNFTSQWPIQVKNDPDRFWPIGFRSGFDIDPFRPILKQYADNVWSVLRKSNKSVRLSGVSMGALIALLVADRAEEEGSGLITGVSLINPGAFGGSISYFNSWSFWQTCYNLYWWPSSEALRRKAKALAAIRKVIPDFKYEVAESPLAQREAVSGEVKLPEHLFGKVKIFHSDRDELIPRPVAETLAKRAGVKLITLKGQFHNPGLLDFQGKVLNKVYEMSG